MTIAYNPLSGNLELKEPGPQGPAGVVSAAGPGSQGTPSISFAADLDTGLYNYTPNGLAISTNGTGRLFVASDGKVGVGTAPGRILHIDSGAVNNSYVRFTNNNSTGNGAEVGLFDDGTAGPSLILANTMADGNVIMTAGGSERLRITSDGKVGLGTSTVEDSTGSSTRLQIQSTNGGSDVALRIKNNSTTADTTSSIRFTNTTSTFDHASIVAGRSPGAYLALKTNDGSTAIHIDSSQRVGVGTTSPGSALHIAGSTPTAPTGDGVHLGLVSNYAQLQLNGSAGGIIDFSTSGVDSIGRILYDQASNYMRFDTNYLERARIDSSGRLLVGTTSNTLSNASVVIRGNPAASGVDGTIQLSRAGLPSATTSGLGAIYFTDNSSNLGAQIRAIADAAWTSGSSHPSRLVFSTTAAGASSPTERMRIDSSGNVGVGTTSPGARLHIEDSGTDAARLRIGFDATRYYDIFRGTPTNPGLLNFYGSQTGYTGYVFGGVDGERARIDSAGRLLVGTSSARTNFFGTTTIGPALQIEGSTTPTCSLSLLREDATADDCKLILAHARGTAHEILQNDDAIGQITWQGADGSRFQQAASIRAHVDGTPGTNDMPGRLVFSTTADGASSPTERLRITSDGKVGVGTTSVAALLHVAGTAAAGDVATRIQNSTATDSGASATLEFVQGAGHPAGKIVSVRQGNYSATAANQDSALAFHTALDGVDYERARIDSSGRLLVGTSTSIAAPDAVGANRDGSLQLAGNLLATTMQGNHFFNVSATGPLYQFTKSNTSTIGNHTIVALNDRLGTFQWSGSDGTNYIPAAQIYAQVDGTPGTNDMPGRLVFSTTAATASSPTERMSIDNAGYIFPDSTSRTSSGSIQATGAPGFRIVSASTSSTVRCECFTNATTLKYAIAFSNPNGIVGSISTNGTATAYNTSSDYRLKENVTAVTDGITRLQQLKPSRFNFIADPDTTVDGFIAHEVQDVVPEAITGEKDAVDADGNPEYQGIDQSKLVPLLTAALQEAIGEIESLKARVAALETP